MEKVKISSKSVEKLRKGYPLVAAKDLINAHDEKKTKQWVSFTTQDGRYIGTGYIGKQNKGIGWILSRDENILLDACFFRNIFEKAKNKRADFFQNKETTAFRLFNGEGDGIGGVTIDAYGDFVLVTWYNESIYSFKKIILDSFSAVFPDYRGVYEKNRFESKNLPETQHIYGEPAPEPLLVKENGATFATYLNEGMMTGIFLDQKEVRGQLIDGMAKGMDVLNTFSYTGAFSVTAALGGAKSTVSVDLAKRSRPKTEEMFEVNQLSLANHHIIVMDTFDYFRYAKRKKISFDLVILDPPGFARNKKRTFSVSQNYGELVEEAVELIRKNGLLLASTNVANLDYGKFVAMVEKGLRAARRNFELIETYRLPADFSVSKDFSEGNYLKVLIYQLTN